MIRNLTALVWSINILAGGTSTVIVSDQLSNSTIEYATEIPHGSPFASAGREVIILAPPQLAKLGPESIGESDIPMLIEQLASLDKDWAANLVLYRLTGRDALSLAGIEKGAPQWRAERKDMDVSYWRAWWPANRGHLVWRHGHLIPEP